MKIAYATTDFVTEKVHGGLGTYISNIATIFAERGNLVSVIVLSDTEEEFIWKNNIAVYRLKYSDEIESCGVYRIRLIRKIATIIKSYFGRSYAINRKVKQLWKENKIDIVQYCNSQEVAVFRYKKVPGIVRVSNFPVLYRYAYLPFFDPKRIEYPLSIRERLQLLSIKTADYAFAPSKIIADITENKIGKKIDVIESPYMNSELLCDESLYNEHLKGKKYLLFFGTLNFLKGIHLIADICDEMFETHPDLYMTFVGNMVEVVYEGKAMSSREYLGKRIKNKDRVVILDAVSDKSKLYGLIDKAYACVLPSRIDNLPNTCIEAMAFGKIVIGTRGASFEQLLTDRESGILCERENSEDLFHCIDSLMQMSETEREDMGLKAQERLREMRPDIVYEKMLRVYVNALKM